MQGKFTNKRLGIALLASFAIHILLALVISLNHQDKPLVKKQAPQFMDVVLLDPKTSAKKTPVKDAKTISNKNAVGGSSKANDRTTRRAKSPMPGKQQHKVKKAMPRAQQAPPPKPKASHKKNRIIALDQSQKSDGLRMQQAPIKKKVKRKPHKPTPRPIPLSNLLPSSMALSELSRDFEREKRMKQMLSREADIPINTKEAKYAPYAHSLVRALEEQWRPGKANYQQFSENSRQVLMRVTIELSGELGNLEILRPSPIAALNESAIEAIHAAAPFKPLPSSWGLDRASFYLTFEVVEDKFVFRAM